ncbi:MAG: NAD-dependent epimerase/dehydratase family protein [Myxococcales bacterium]|nr:NAD-dependent epimerase/dehydratase family protein [Myxococcales bacterium]
MASDRVVSYQATAMVAGRTHRRVGVTGAASDLGRVLLPRLLEDPRVTEIVVFDVTRPVDLPERVRFVRLDLLRPGAEGDLERALFEARLDALYHLAFVNSRVHRASFAHELEVIGTLHLLAAAGAVKVPRLIVPSLTVLYGARAQNPAYATETQPLQTVPGIRFVSDRFEVERQLAEFVDRFPEVEVLVLRFAPIVGPSSNNPFTRLVRARVVPTVMGFDPLWQVVHEDDAGRALHLALHTRARGIFNIVGEGVAPVSSLLRAAGTTTLPMAGPLLRSAVTALEAVGLPASPWALMDFFRYSWLADGRRAARDLHFLPHLPVHEAMATMTRRG